MGRPKKKEISLNTTSFLSVAQEAYNELVEQRSTAIRQINENKKKVEVDDMHDLTGLNKANTDLLNLVDKTIDKKLSLVKLMSQLIFKNDSSDTSGGGGGELTPEDIDMLRTIMTKDDEKGA